MGKNERENVLVLLMPLTKQISLVGFKLSSLSLIPPPHLLPLVSKHTSIVILNQFACPCLCIRTLIILLLYFTENVLPHKICKSVRS